MPGRGGQAADAEGIVIVGGGGLAREMVAMGHLGDAPAGWVADLAPAGDEKCPLLLPFLGNLEDCRARKFLMVCGVGSPELKRKFVARGQGLSFLPLWRAKSAEIGARVDIGEGAVVLAKAVITDHVRIGRHVTINFSSTVAHDSAVGDFTTLSPGVHISGGASLGEGVLVGTGAIILPGVKVGDWAMIGAGSVVTSDVAPLTSVFGAPARRLPGRGQGLPPGRAVHVDGDAGGR